MSHAPAPHLGDCADEPGLIARFKEGGAIDSRKRTDFLPVDDLASSIERDGMDGPGASWKPDYYVSERLGRTELRQRLAAYADDTGWHGRPLAPVGE